MLDRSSRRSPSTITCEWVSFSGLSKTGFIRTSGTTRAASAWKYCALPISPPATTRALLLMFCALNGATLSPRREYHRASAVARKLLPAPLVVPHTMTARARVELDAGVEFPGDFAQQAGDVAAERAPRLEVELIGASAPQHHLGLGKHGTRAHADGKLGKIQIERAGAAQNVF